MAYSWAAAAGIDDESVPIPAAGVAAWAVVDDLRHEANREQSDWDLWSHAGDDDDVEDGLHLR